jgi:hypothetical protein
VPTAIHMNIYCSNTILIQADSDANIPARLLVLEEGQRMTIWLGSELCVADLVCKS